MNGCTALSEEVLVDGLAFISPALYTGGDAPRAIEDGGLLRYCDGDTATLTLGEPYTASITWFRDGMSVPGAHAPTLFVTGSGSYTAHAAPGLCPEVVFSVDVTVTMAFDVPEVPIILNVGGVLCASPFSNAYSWFLNGAPDPVGVGTCHEPLEPGSYTAQLLTGEECTAPSAPYLYLPTGISPAPAAASFPVRVHNNDLLVERPSSGPAVTHWRIQDAQGRLVLGGPFPAGNLQVDLSAAAADMLLFQPLQEGHAVAPVTRFVLTR